MQYCKSVTLRMRDRRNGTKSLFLDFWPGYRNPETMELIRRRSLGMYIYANPISTQQKKYNEAILAKAEAIRCKYPYLRVNEFLALYEDYNETDKYKIIVFYPGHRDQNSFRLFDTLPDNHTYRATLLINE